MTIKNCAYAAGFAASLVLLAACGDDVTEVTQVSEKASLDQVEKFKKLPKCEEDVEGDLVYVKDSAKVFVCTGDGWISLDGKDGVSGKDGEAGKDGKDGEAGKDGKDASGSACTVSEAKDGGFDVKCDGKTVGTIKNGKDGKDGENCTAKETKDGYEIVCGGETIGTFKNGKNGDDGDDGDNCSLTEGENGAVTVKCGSKAATLFKAVCGTDSYDPATQICYEGGGTFTVVPRCKNQKVRFGDWFRDLKDFSEFPYDPTEYFCDENSVLQPLCQWVDDEGKPVSKKYDPSKEYCDAQNKKISDKVPCAEGSSEMRKPTEFCYTTNGDSRVRTEELYVCGSGNSAKQYSPVTHFCSKSTGVLDTMLVCGDASADPFNIDIRYKANEGMDDHKGQLCDTRDYQIYNFLTVGDISWMTDNLRFAYLGKTAGLDSSSFCYENDCSRMNGVRAYLWSAVIDSAKLAGSDIFCGYGEPACKFTEPVKGVCPDGWHVPSSTEIPRGKFSLTPPSAPIVYTYGGADLNFDLMSSYVYSSTDYDDTEGEGTVFSYANDISASDGHDTGARNKSAALPVRCVKDYPAGE